MISKSCVAIPLITYVRIFKWDDVSVQAIKKKHGLPSGELTFCHGKSPFLMGNPLFLWPFSIAFCVFTRPGTQNSECHHCSADGQRSTLNLGNLEKLDLV